MSIDLNYGGARLKRRDEQAFLTAMSKGVDGVQFLLGKRPLHVFLSLDLDRFHLVMNVVNRVPKLGYRAAYLKQLMGDKPTEHSH